MNEIEKRLLTTEEASIYLGLSRSALRQIRMSKGNRPNIPHIPFFKVGGAVLYDLQDLDIWIEERKNDQIREELAKMDAEA